jgi:hypothetical protein
MKNHLFSPSTCGFYDPTYENDYKIAGTWPKDLVEVSNETLLSFVGSSPYGKVISSRYDGQPCWIDAPKPTKEDLELINTREKESKISAANDYINSKQWPGKAAIGRLKGDDLAQYNLWLDYLDALELVDASSDEISWPESPKG